MTPATSETGKDLRVRFASSFARGETCHPDPEFNPVKFPQNVSDGNKDRSGNNTEGDTLVVNLKMAACCLHERRQRVRKRQTR